MTDRNIKIKKPVSGKKVAKVPVVMQMEALECGAASLAMILAYYEKWIPLEQVRSDCGVSRDGSKASNVIKAARSYGMEVAGYRMEPEVLREEGEFPCIIHWEFNHFVVLNGFKGNKAILNDPARGTWSVPMDRFDESFTGVCIFFEPGEDFEPGGKPKSVLEFAASRLKGTGSAVVFTVITSIIAALFELLNPAFSRVFLDRLLTGQNPELLVPFTIFLAAFTAAQIFTLFVQSIMSYRIDGKMAVVGSTSYMWKVLRLPMEFFSQRMAGDIQLRQATNEQIAGTLVNTLAPLVLQGGAMVLYLVIMVRYSLMLSIIGILSIILNLAVSRIISKERVNITRVRLRDSGKLAGTAASGIEMIETIKASGAENGFFSKWAGYQASVNTQNIKYLKLNQMLGTVPTLVNNLTNTLITILGVWLVMEGEFTSGMVLAFQGFLTSFQSPATTLISAGQTIQEMRTDMERVEDVMKYPCDVEIDGDDMIPEDAEGLQKLTGNIQLNHVSFGYSSLEKPLLEDFNINIKPGGQVAFVGPSGCGKSTLSKLISGLYKPWSGEILYDGKPISEINRGIFTGSLAVVDQDITLFEDTIANNIKLWDHSIEDFEMILAARDAQIHDDILQRDGGYNYRILENGKDFSGGQRQRLEIARVLAQDPTIIILDEATSALDAKTEFEVLKAIRDRGITCITIAHRLSAIRDCDEIVVLKNGTVVERGTHDELYAMNGMYSKLVENE